MAELSGLLDCASLNEQMKKTLAEAYGPAPTVEVFKAQNERYHKTLGLLETLLTPGADHHNLPHINFSEAVRMNDFGILFPKAVEGALARTKEGPYIGQKLFTRTLRVQGVEYMTFPTFIGGMVVEPLGDTQEPAEQKGAFKEAVKRLTTQRYGLKLEFAKSVIERSQWDIVSLYLEEAGKAFQRNREMLVWQQYEANAITIFDNSSGDSRYWTRGVGANGVARNGSFDRRDLYDLIAAVSAQGGQPSDIVIHSLTAPIWLTDPFLQYQLLHRGAVGQTMGAPSTDANGQANNLSTYIPFGLNPVVTPFQTLNLDNTLSTGISGSVSHTTTITVVDREKKILTLEERPMRMVKYENVLRDIQGMMIDERFGMLLADGGRGSACAKNVRIVDNEKPLYTVRNVPVS